MIAKVWQGRTVHVFQDTGRASDRDPLGDVRQLSPVMMWVASQSL